MRASPSARHWLGTDAAGRDVAARLVWGARPSLTVGVLAVALYLAFGALLGALAGYYGGWVDLVIQRLIEVVITMPALFLVLAAAAFIEQRSFVHVLLIIAAVGWTTPARLVRAELLRLRGLDFVLAARASGYPERTILWREILPNVRDTLAVQGAMQWSWIMLGISSLSFLGLGVAPPTPDWGLMIADGRGVMQVAPWAVLWPMAMLSSLIVGVNLAADAFAKALGVDRTPGVAVA